MSGEDGVVTETVGGVPVVVMWGSPDTADALDTETVAEARSIGSAVAYDRRVAGRRLSFVTVGDHFVDPETGSTWTILGKAVDGPLAGRELAWVTHRNEFWFAWTAFFPDGSVYGG